MKITWYGHSCFKIKGSDGSVVLDPYEKGYVPGLDMGEISADLVYSTHEHRDHSAICEVNLSNLETEVHVKYITSSHDKNEGKDRGENNIISITMDDMHIVHLGDLGHELEKEDIDKIGKVDILMVPVGGHYTIDTKEALNIVKEINPRITIPMHYRDDEAKYGYPVLSTVDKFKNASLNVIEVGNEFNPLVIEGSATVVMTPNCIIERETNE